MKALVINWLRGVTGQEVINDTARDEYTVYFAIIFFNLSQSQVWHKVWNTDAHLHIPQFFIPIIIHFSISCLLKFCLCLTVLSRFLWLPSRFFGLIFSTAPIFYIEP